MEELQKLIESTLEKVPRIILERRLAEKLKEAGLSADTTTLFQAAAHILSGSPDAFKFESEGDITIQITNDDIEYVEKATEQFHNERLAGILDEVGDHAANRLFKRLSRTWPKHFEALQADIDAFKERLEQRWGKALTKLRMFLAIVMEWSQRAYERQLRVGRNKLSHLDDVLLRLHARACQVTNEIIVLLEMGTRMAQWHVGAPFTRSQWSQRSLRSSVMSWQKDMSTTRLLNRSEQWKFTTEFARTSVSSLCPRSKLIKLGEITRKSVGDSAKHSIKNLENMAGPLIT
jgi:hypothetical protein